MSKRLFSCYSRTIDGYTLEWAESTDALKHFDCVQDITDKPLAYISRNGLETLRKYARTTEEKTLYSALLATL